MTSGNGTLKRWLLVNYSGYPFALNSLILDNGLANLAGVLLEAGCEVSILDYATVSMLERLTPPDLHERLKRAWNGIMPPDGGKPGTLAKLRIVAGLHRAERQRQRYQQEMLGRISEEIIARVRRDGIQAIGFKLWNGDGIQGASFIANAVRKACPDVRLFGGGPQVDIFMEHLLDQCAAFDALSFGEGEVTIRHLAEAGNDPAAYPDLPNLVFRRDGAPQVTEARPVEDMDSLPLPVYDPAVYPAAEGNEKIHIIVIDDSRGCRNNCAFCIHPIKSSRDRRIRLKSVAHLADEVEALQGRYGINTFRFAGSCTPYEHLRAFADEALRRDLGILYGSFAHVRESAASDYDAIRQSGCAALFFGIESGSQRVLNAMRKGIKAEDIPSAPSILKIRIAS